MLGHESTTQSLGDNTARSLPIAHLLIQYIHGCVLYQRPAWLKDLGFSKVQS
ncbi:hypothetical protein PISMIDRAFT_685240 [Pisolithus microcarpus 441]|uniref:Uncharacterized protein n=1 Tax=Pisolithus microcarpus 441 TaxID=765257 RepID=A0A0C9YTZ4_9AGAM|nr:hypothetical protein PISMIDRAFT_685240 [Pisolithus microcarpus 441]